MTDIICALLFVVVTGLVLRWLFPKKEKVVIVPHTEDVEPKYNVPTFYTKRIPEEVPHNTIPYREASFVDESFTRDGDTYKTSVDDSLTTNILVGVAIEDFLLATTTDTNTNDYTAPDVTFGGGESGGGGASSDW